LNVSFSLNVPEPVA